MNATPAAPLLIFSLRANGRFPWHRRTYKIIMCILCGERFFGPCAREYTAKTRLGNMEVVGYIDDMRVHTQRQFPLFFASFLCNFRFVCVCVRGMRAEKFIQAESEISNFTTLSLYGNDDGKRMAGVDA